MLNHSYFPKDSDELGVFHTPTPTETDKQEAFEEVEKQKVFDGNDSSFFMEAQEEKVYMAVEADMDSSSFAILSTETVPCLTEDSLCVCLFGKGTTDFVYKVLREIHSQFSRVQIGLSDIFTGKAIPLLEEGKTMHRWGKGLSHRPREYFFTSEVGFSSQTESYSACLHSFEEPIDRVLEKINGAFMESRMLQKSHKLLLFLDPEEDDEKVFAMTRYFLASIDSKKYPLLREIGIVQYNFEQNARLLDYDYEVSNSLPQVIEDYYCQGEEDMSWALGESINLLRSLGIRVSFHCFSLTGACFSYAGEDISGLGEDCNVLEIMSQIAEFSFSG
ncbi:MAG: hypothetical protein HUU50_12460 [Candidatus Brocadiae bacterium]|nr:hypothetical protein [Candidatus Brocadiia bacterium]